MKLIVPAFFATALIVSPAIVIAQSNQATTADAMQNIDAQTFVTGAASGGGFELKSSELALQKSQNKEVQAFAQQMIDDHTKANQELKAAAQADNMQPPPEGQLNEKHQAMVQQLEAADGQAFDLSYMRSQSMAHDEAITLFDAYSKSGQDGQLKSFAAKTLPALQEHKQHIQRLTALK
jgi:putative membrane protein